METDNCVQSVHIFNTCRLQVPLWDEMVYLLPFYCDTTKALAIMENYQRNSASLYLLTQIYFLT